MLVILFTDASFSATIKSKYNLLAVDCVTLMTAVKSCTKSEFNFLNVNDSHWNSQENTPADFTACYQSFQRETTLYQQRTNGLGRSQRKIWIIQSGTINNTYLWY